MIALDVKPIRPNILGSLGDKRKSLSQNSQDFSRDSLKPKTQKIQSADSEKLFVYLIEDDSHFRETFLDVMSLRDVKAQSASCGSQALRELETLRPTVIIVDVRLPDVHGFDLCRLIRRNEEFKKTPIILLSASFRYNDPRDQVEGLLAGASAFLSKPITMEKLLAEIDLLLRRSDR